MAVSQLSKELKIIRILHDINRAQMAKGLKLPDKELVAIEAGKLEVTDSFLREVATKYSKDGDGGEGLLTKLKAAHVSSITSVFFRFTELNESQRLRVVALRDELDRENAAAMAEAEAERKKERERRVAERAERAERAKAKSPSVATNVASDDAEEQVIESSKPEEAPKAATSEELSEEDLDMLALLEEEMD